MDTILFIVGLIIINVLFYHIGIYIKKKIKKDKNKVLNYMRHKRRLYKKVDRCKIFPDRDLYFDIKGSIRDGDDLEQFLRVKEHLKKNGTYYERS